MFSVFRFVCGTIALAPGVPTAAPARSTPALATSSETVVAHLDVLPMPDDGAVTVDGAPPVTARSLIGPPEPPAPTLLQGEPRPMSFGGRVGTVKWELVGALAALTYTNVNSISGETQGFRFVDEGYFGRDTGQVGLDKLAHAWNGYVFTDVLYKRMARKVGGGARTAWTAAALGMALQTYGEVYDGFHRGSGFSWQDMGFNAAGVGFSVLRHTVPGVASKVDYRTYFVPVDRPDGLGDPDRFEKQRFLLAVKGAGFGAINRTPLRFAELHLGYHGRYFSGTDRQIGLTPERRMFVGVGFNLSEALFKRKRGAAPSVARSALEYVQLPYTAVHTDLTR